MSYVFFWVLLVQVNQPQDVLIVSYEGVQYYANDGKGVFQEQGKLFGEAGMTGGAVADFDGDGKLDLVTSGRNGTPNFFWRRTDDGFEKAQIMPSNMSWKVKAGDLDGDGDQDLFFVNNYDYGNQRAIANEVWLNDGQGHFRRSPQKHHEIYSNNAVLHDFDGDGDLDAFVANRGAEEIWRNNGRAALSFAGNPVGSTDSQSNGIAKGDLNGDGFVDIYVANTGPDALFFGDGKGNFRASKQALDAGDGFSADIADLDGDGDLDVFVAARSHEPNKVWINDGKGHLTDSGQRLGKKYSLGVTLADYNGDGFMDALVANRHASKDSGEAHSVLWLNDGKGVFKAEAEMGWTRHRQVLLVPR